MFFGNDNIIEQILENNSPQNSVIWREEKKVHRCPVCDGKGLVPHGFYTAIGVESFTSSSISPEECRTCNGKGVIIA